jgi:hypothetical protein
MARPKGKLFALLAVFAAIGLVAASGAFTSVAADRTAQVNVTGDSSALLELSEPSEIDEGAVNIGADGEATIDLTSDGLTNANGLNPNATTALTPLLNVTNQGTEPVNITIDVTSVGGGATGFDEADVEVVDASNSTIEGTAQTNIGQGSTVQFGLVFDLRSDDVGADELSDDFEITIEITAEESS